MKRLFVCVCSGVLFAGLGLAQNVDASLGGTVADASGAVMPGALGTAARNQATSSELAKTACARISDAIVAMTATRRTS